MGSTSFQCSFQVKGTNLKLQLKLKLRLKHCDKETKLLLEQLDDQSIQINQLLFRFGHFLKPNILYSSILKVRIYCFYLSLMRVNKTLWVLDWSLDENKHFDAVF